MVIDLTKEYRKPEDDKRYHDLLKISDLRQQGKTSEEMSDILKVPVSYIEEIESCAIII